MSFITSRTFYFLLRIAMGFVFLWSFLDKAFGLGFNTPQASAWIQGGSPTAGFLLNATQGPFASFFQSFAGNPIVDWIFMIGLLCIGLSLLLDRFVRIGGLAGMLMMILIYLAMLWPDTNPIINYQLIYALILGYMGLRSHT